MKTIRQEIIDTLMNPFRKENLEKYPLTKQQVEKGIEMKTDAILKLFEKLIDEKIKYAELDDFAKYKIKALKELKEEFI